MGHGKRQVGLWKTVLAEHVHTSGDMRDRPGQRNARVKCTPPGVVSSAGARVVKRSACAYLQIEIEEEQLEPIVGFPPQLVSQVIRRLLAVDVNGVRCVHASFRPRIGRRHGRCLRIRRQTWTAWNVDGTRLCRRRAGGTRNSSSRRGVKSGR